MTTQHTEPLQLTTEEQAALGSGGGFTSTKAVGDVPAITLVDGSAGVRMQDMSQGADHLGLRPALPATAFPCATVMAQTWNPELVHRVARALGTEAQAAGVQVLLGPGVNMKRDPRAGRNFEYYSEDPYLTGVLASAYVQGLQSQGVGASLKHFAANNTEHERFRSSSDVDARPLREIYLRAFQRVVRDAQPWTVMCSYNRINGVPAAEDRWLLTDVLRGEWGFEGAVLSDWGAVDDRVASVRAGLDLEMPADRGRHDRALVHAVLAGYLSARQVEQAAQRVARLARHAKAAARPDTRWDVDEHHALAREAAAQGLVLLKNDDAVLPLVDAEGPLAVIGEFAVKPRCQGGGSSYVTATRIDVPLDEIRALAGEALVEYAPGFTTDAATDAAPDDPALLREAVELAARSRTAVIFLGLAGSQEAEGFDRTSIELPQEQLELLRAVHRVQPRTVVVLAHGGVLRLAPLVDHAAAVLDCGLSGQAAGGAVADVLFGRVNPSGRLAETVPERIESTPAFLNFPGENLHVRYGEGLFMGYRWYDARKLEVTFPFGHGLSYATFRYSDLVLEGSAEGVTVRLRVANTGSRAGREIVQVYTGVAGSTVVRPEQELKGFAPVWLEPGEEREVTVQVRREDLAYWHTALDRWVVEGGEYTVGVGASSRDIRLTGQLALTGDHAPVPLTPGSSITEVLANPVAAAELGELFGAAFGGLGDSQAAGMGLDILKMIGSTPVQRFLTSLGGGMGLARVQDILDRANAAVGAVPNGR
ncbi:MULTISPECIES: glycoside hydrolase family 3 C-terminal domain-containing protein [Streptacidiphilus]|uniref:Glycoside hydrolase family 3 C-terminal domain-containing protein n=1 Tax=Streptacidiphilus cavernicola TaxID=3342716 RepID=A0ABV6URN3_9ACTN|nr:glycoside hydrolase family 3 C-terminal domain-containing protein [Streptacidiphilus jeojiense]